MANIAATLPSSSPGTFTRDAPPERLLPYYSAALRTSPSMKASVLARPWGGIVTP